MAPAQARGDVKAGIEPADAAGIFVFDLALVLPAFTATAVLLWRGARWGDILALPLLLKTATKGLSVLLVTLIAPGLGQPINIGEVATCAVRATFPATLLWPWWRAFAS